MASAAILSACDALDGLVDGIIDNYHACTARKVYPALASYTCGTGSHGSTPHGGTCLTSGQVDALKKIYAGPVNSKGERLYSNWFWDAGIWTPPTAPGAGWQFWNVVTAPVPGVNTAINLTLGAGAIPMIFQTPPVVTPVNGPTGQEAFVFKFNFDTDAPKIFTKTAAYPESSMDFMAAVATDLRPFRSRGGKLIISSSVNDGIFSGAAIARWYRQMNQAHGQSRDRFCPAVHGAQHGPLRRRRRPPTTSRRTSSRRSRTGSNTASRRNASSRPTPTPASPYPTGGVFDPRIAQNFPTGGTRPLCVYPRICGV